MIIVAKYVGPSTSAVPKDAYVHIVNQSYSPSSGNVRLCFIYKGVFYTKPWGELEFAYYTDGKHKYDFDLNIIRESKKKI